ncbi:MULTISPECIES: ZIP family metal transporter [Anaeromyxobacter]|uniref:ZIP family metal transporter n=1 Tax=Anaeromyxobacter TaxID=161492 RepID=UPI001F5893CC|nr:MULTISPECIES: ZIP family metal transporter [unclassified Anaeromyxobacter]
MTELQSLATYTGAILAGALAGGALPLFGAMRRSDVLLSFSAGVMLGAAFFHMLPEAVEAGGAAALPYAMLGFLLLYLLERFVLVHVCAEPGPGGVPELDPHVHGAPAHVHVHGDATGCGVHTMGLAAFVGMSLHTIVDGFALGAANVEAELGLLVFLAILAHKIPNAFSLSAILRAEGYTRGRALAMNAAFALMVPLGAGLYVLLRETVHVEAFTSIALAASAGTFLHLSLSDILPDLHRRGVARWRLSIAMIGGLVLMWALRLLRAGHGH